MTQAIVEIHESGMVFGPYSTDSCLHIEKAQTYQRIVQGVKTVEFLLYKTMPNRILVVEAKSSSPRPGSDNFNKYIDDIRNKFLNGLSLFIAMRIGRHPDADLPINMAKTDISKVNFVFVLVINGHREDWLQPLADALNKSLHAAIKIWAAHPRVAVLNDQYARKMGLIT